MNISTYFHGTRAEFHANPARVADRGRAAIVCVGTAPIHTAESGAGNVNRPVVVNNFAEAVAKFGYSEDWASYTLCEVMWHILAHRAVAPLVMINVFDPEKYKAKDGGSASLTPVGGSVTIATDGNAVLESIAVAGKKPDEDYEVSYNYSSGLITISETRKGSLGTEALTVTYDVVDPSGLDEVDVIGSSDGEGLNTGLYAIKNVYQVTKYIPSMLIAPGFSEMPAVHDAMLENSMGINGHWNAYVYADLPAVDEKGVDITMSTASAWAKANGYCASNEKVFFPYVSGTDGRKYHISTLAAGSMLELLTQNDGIPFQSPSNTTCEIIQNLYVGAGSEGRMYDDQLINEKLNRHGITSAAFVGGRWAIWGAHTADYEFGESERISSEDTALMMLFYVANDFQERRFEDVDKPMTPNALNAIMAQEQSRLDALKGSGRLASGKVYIKASADARSDMMSGDYKFTFDVATTPLAKSLTADVGYDEDGFTAYIDLMLEGVSA